ncbi:Poly [ADP-ribose] polymerase 3, partial [Paramuricea clavata]
MCERPLHADEIYNIMFFLSTEDVLRCMQVCKYWKTILLEQIFWRKHIRKRFDLKAVTKKEELEGPLYQWSDSTI